MRRSQKDIKVTGHQPSAISRQRGFTLIEIMIGLLIISVAFASLGAVFSSIGKAILVNKNKTIAVNLAQEKIESLKDLSYYRLLVTTSSTYDDNFSPRVGPYDTGTTQSYYPEETLVVGERTFKRRVYVEFVKDVGGDFYGEPWTANDTGIKRITVYVVWQEGDEWKKVELRNLRNNPDRMALEYTFTGTVSSDTAGNPPIYNALVDTVENPSYFARTDAYGKYSFKVSPGSYTLRAAATGYFTATSTPYIVNTGHAGQSTQDFALTLKALGTATGYAYIRDHLIITQIFLGTGTSSDDNGMHQWVELYNPTTYNILIASRPTSTSQWSIFYVTVTYISHTNQEPPGGRARYLIGNPALNPDTAFIAFRSTSLHWTAETTSISIPTQHFFLIANQSTITFNTPGGKVERIADAYYKDQVMPSSTTARGGVRVTGNSGYSYNSRTDWHDGFAWDDDAISGSGCPSLAREGSTCWEYFKAPGTCASESEGIADKVMFRYTRRYGSGNSNTNIINRQHSSSPANNFDRDFHASAIWSAGSDWAYEYISGIETNCGAYESSDFHLSSWSVLNADFSLTPFSGTPAAGASVSATDGMSAVAYVQTYGSFTLTNIATGTWNVTVASGNYIRDISSLTVTAAILSTSILNNSTDPKWEFSTLNWGPIALTTSSIYGYISGIVYNVGARVNAADVITSGASAVTDSQGRYRLKVDASQSPFSVQASKSGLSTEVIGSIGVNVGVNISTVDFNLVGAGSVKGFVTTNGAASGALPGIPVVANSLSSATLGSAITDASGNFNIPSVQTGTVVISLGLESGETSNPETKVWTITTISTGMWVGTFTVTNAFGKITGTVGTGSSTAPITTGVLLVAATQQITSEAPPTLDSSLRAGTSIHYAVSSDALGKYSLPLRGNASYYLYGWYPTSLGVNSSSAPKRFAGRIWVGPGATVTKDLSW